MTSASRRDADVKESQLPRKGKMNVREEGATDLSDSESNRECLLSTAITDPRAITILQSKWLCTYNRASKAAGQAERGVHRSTGHVTA